MGLTEKTGQFKAFNGDYEDLMAAFRLCVEAGQELRRRQEEFETRLDGLPAQLREKEILLREVHHRVNNNLQVILDLFRLQLHHVQDPQVRALLVESQNRIYAMSLIHEKLYHASGEGWLSFGEYMGGLSAHVLRSYGARSRQVEVAVEAPDIALDIQTMIPCGLIVNELLSNALKYAFPDERPGCIRIELETLPEQRYRLVVHDNGVGFPPDLDIGQAESLGFQIVAALSEQLGGTWQRSGPPGTTVAITFQERKTNERRSSP